jgi:hypothetical protein
MMGLRQADLLAMLLSCDIPVFQHSLSGVFHGESDWTENGNLFLGRP